MDRGYIYLSKKSFLHNIEVLKNLSKKELCLVVKANAYGHGLDWAVKIAKESGVKWFAVASVDEGIEVKKVYGDSQVLLLAEPSKIQLKNLKFKDPSIKKNIENLKEQKNQLKIEKGELEEKYKDLAYEHEQLSKKLYELKSQEKIEKEKQLKFSEKIDELNQETDILIDEIDKWQT